MKLKHVVLLMTALIAACKPGMHTSGGGAGCCSTLIPRIQYGTMYATTTSDTNERLWLRAVVLWRGSKPFSLHFSDSSVAIGRAAGAARLAAQRAGREFIGGFDSNGIIISSTIPTAPGCGCSINLSPSRRGIRRSS